MTDPCESVSSGPQESRRALLKSDLNLGLRQGYQGGRIDEIAKDVIGFGLRVPVAPLDLEETVQAARQRCAVLAGSVGSGCVDRS